MTDMTDGAPKSRGWRRVAELRRQDEAAKQEIITGLINDLGRPATMNDRLAIEDIASLTIWARTLERRAKFADAAAVRDQISRARRASGIKPAPRVAVPKPDFREEMLRLATPGAQS
jgi:hypothetical protein